MLVLTLCSHAGFSEELSAEQASEEFAGNWYRSVRMHTWLWEGAEKTTIEATLGRIANGGGERRSEDLADTLLEYGPGNWIYEFSSAAQEAYAAGVESEQLANRVAARIHFLRASVYYTIASYPHLRDRHSRRALSDAFDAYKKAGRHFIVPLQTWEMTVDGVDFPAFIHMPGQASGRPIPVILKTGGMDVLSTEFYPLYSRLNELGIAMIVFDMPGTGNLGIVAEDSEKHHEAVIRRVLKDKRFDPERIAVWSESLAGMPAVKVAVTQQENLAAVVNSCGLLHAVHSDLGLPPPQGVQLDTILAAYRNGELSEDQIAELNHRMSSPEYEERSQGFQFEVYVDRVRARPGSILDLFARSRPLSLYHQAILGKGVVTQVPLLTVNTHVDPLVPMAESLMATDASLRGTLMLFGEHEGHCVSRSLAVDEVIDWLAARLM